MLFRETVAVYCENHMEHPNTLCGQNAVYINSVLTSQETHDVSVTKPNRLTLFNGIIAVYCENHTEHTSTLCGQNVELFDLITNHCALKTRKENRVNKQKQQVHTARVHKHCHSRGAAVVEPVVGDDLPQMNYLPSYTIKLQLARLLG
jgi:hypothetical protein